MRKEDAISADNSLVELQRLMRRWSLTQEEHHDPAWRKSVTDEFTKFAQATGIVPRDSDPYGPLDFVAKILYAHDCATSGKEPIRWALLQVDLKEKFRGQAVQTVASWANEELHHERLMGMKSGKLTD